MPPLRGWRVLRWASRAALEACGDSIKRAGRPLHTTLAGASSTCRASIQDGFQAGGGEWDLADSCAGGVEDCVAEGGGD